MLILNVTLEVISNFLRLNILVVDLEKCWMLFWIYFLRFTAIIIDARNVSNTAKSLDSITLGSPLF